MSPEYFQGKPCSRTTALTGYRYQADTSASGKTLIVASTKENAVATVEVNGKSITIGLNAYIRP